MNIAGIMQGFTVRMLKTQEPPPLPPNARQIVHSFDLTNPKKDKKNSLRWVEKSLSSNGYVCHEHETSYSRHHVT